VSAFVCLFVTSSFDLLTLKLVRNAARVVGYLPANFGETMINCFRFMGHWANTAQTDRATLIFDLGGHSACG